MAPEPPSLKETKELPPKIPAPEPEAATAESILNAIVRDTLLAGPACHDYGWRSGPPDMKKLEKEVQGRNIKNFFVEFEWLLHF